MAPDFYDDLGKYSELVDIWAFGMAVIEMVTLEYPYTGDPPGQILLKVLNVGALPLLPHPRLHANPAEE